MALVKKVDGISLKDLAETRGTKNQIRSIMAEVREMLKLIHEEWGFFGAINLESIFYDVYTKKITLVDWYRNNFPFKHYPHDHRYGVVWPYNKMMKTCDDKLYRCFDKLAVFCCFARFLEIKCI